MAVTKKKTTKKVVRKPLTVNKTKKLAPKKATKKVSTKKAPSTKQAPNSWSDFTIEEKKMMLRARRIHWNDAKKKIAVDMLERYTGHNLEDFQKQIILTNFGYYTERFNILLDDAVCTKGSAFKASSSKKAKVTIVEFGVGSAMAALIGELLSVVQPKATLFLGLCGSVHPSLKVG